MSKAAPHVASYERILTKSRFYWRMDNAPHSAMRTKKAALSPCSFACRPSLRKPLFEPLQNSARPGSVAFVNDTSKELTKGTAPVVDRELTAPPFIVATVVMEKSLFSVKEACLTQPIV
ncbi:hypothetical protein FNV43_RR08244 [Rhamnella rubrinervis]|uniref:Uncharacterized protein n=1 Tax=Rhamnella rubrinervis TaxID=2594499 RepID=A0A8K0HG64_9ROSA|nr:hypothetical protein FNV43_RR08244 [Rhamnella rubrinervis]